MQSTILLLNKICRFRGKHTIADLKSRCQCSISQFFLKISTYQIGMSVIMIIQCSSCKGFLEMPASQNLHFIGKETRAQMDLKDLHITSQCSSVPFLKTKDSLLIVFQGMLISNQNHVHHEVKIFTYFKLKFILKGNTLDVCVYTCINVSIHRYFYLKLVRCTCVHFW